MTWLKYWCNELRRAFWEEIRDPAPVIKLLMVLLIPFLLWGVFLFGKWIGRQFEPRSLRDEGRKSETLSPAELQMSPDELRERERR
jgi:hypothetical protein